MSASTPQAMAAARTPHIGNDMPRSSLRPRLRPDNLDTSIRPDPATGDAAGTATITAEFDPRAPLLLGTFGTERSRGAILRLPNGRISKVGVGDEVAGDRVVAIGDGSVMLAQGGRTTKVEIPGA